jgi:5'-nucleotidase
MMTKEGRAQILLTNDDGIRSPGLWAAAEALQQLGFVTVVAPREQQSGIGRGFPTSSDGIIDERKVEVGGKSWTVYAIGGSPAQAVQHAVLEILPEKPNLIVSGINFGENVGSGVTVSGTVGAALEGAASGVPSIAVSLQTDISLHGEYSDEVDFSAAAYFTGYFANLILATEPTPDVDVLKIEIPCDATPSTPWEVTRLSRERYFLPNRPKRSDLNEPYALSYRQSTYIEKFKPGTDAYAIQVARVVSVTPLSLDLTSRVDLDAFEEDLRSKSTES